MRYTSSQLSAIHAVDDHLQIIACAACEHAGICR